MKTRLILPISAVLFFFVVLAGASSAFADYPWISSNSWHLKSQTQRNSAILSTATKYNTLYSGKFCKEWVTSIVKEASSNHVSLPSNLQSPYDYMWDSSNPANFYHATAICIPIDYVLPGEIIQMRLSSGAPHTAIVVSNSGGKITFIESNWDSTPNNATDAFISTHTDTYSKFYSRLQSPSSFTVYYIQ